MRTWILAGAVCGAVVTGGAARAQGLESQRVLNGHAFQPSFLVRTPFAVTTFDANLVYGIGNATGPTYDVDGNVNGERDYTFAAMGQTFAYEKTITDGISAGGGLSTTLYSGTDGPSALVVGADVNVGVSGRVTAGRRLGPVQAAATFDVSYGPRLGIVVIDAVRDAMANGIGSGSALALDDVLTVRPGAAVAWAPHAALGVTASADYQWIALDKEVGSSEGSALGVGVVADLDLRELTEVSLGLLAGIHWLEPLDGEDVSRVQDYSVGAFYTAKPELVLGAEVGWRSFEIRPGLDSSGMILQVRAAYLW
ncbi:MAG TPA: hypothetical protein VFL83_14430 [Anaeromyxobacter sp.]|nr:hypothetical protein [Anaeromyxobacter sp.]